jgi:hypothetical protein
MAGKFTMVKTKRYLDGIFAPFNNAGAEGVANGFVDVVDFELAENIPAVGVDGVETEIFVGGDFFGGAAEGNGA